MASVSDSRPQARQGGAQGRVKVAAKGVEVLVGSGCLTRFGAAGDADGRGAGRVDIGDGSDAGGSQSLISTAQTRPARLSGRACRFSPSREVSRGLLSVRVRFTRSRHSIVCPVTLSNRTAFSFSSYTPHAIMATVNWRPAGWRSLCVAVQVWRTGRHITRLEPSVAQRTIRPTA